MFAGTLEIMENYIISVIQHLLLMSRGAKAEIIVAIQLFAE
jgi:hypothetical protein